MDIQDILVRIENSNPVDDSWHDLRCRLTDCANEIQNLRAKVEVLEEALYKLRTYNDEYIKNGRVDFIVCEALATYDKLSGGSDDL